MTTAYDRAHRAHAPDEFDLKRLSATMAALALRVEVEEHAFEDLAEHAIAVAACRWLRRQSAAQLWALMDAHGLDGV